MDRSPAARTPAPAAPELHLFDDADRSDTRGKILDAAFRRLATEGYAALSVREIARDAGVNHALINYHFRTKDQLVIEVLDAANRRLLARQSAMYRGPGSFAEKWSEARRFYESDLASGFVRVQAELWAASLANAELREKFLPRVLAWKQLVLDAVREAMAAAESHGVTLPPAITAEVVACWISQFWLGMEWADLLDVKQERALHREALDAVQWLLRWLDTQGNGGAAARAAAQLRTGKAPKVAKSNAHATPTQTTRRAAKIRTAPKPRTRG
jgi:AcrR family transcriptional regulator